MSLYDHLVELVYKTLEKNPNNIANDAKSLPQFSHEHKKTAFRPHPKRTDKVYAQNVPPAPRVVKRAAETATLFQTPPPKVSTTVEKPTPNVTVTTTTVKPRKAPTYRSVAMESRYFELIGASPSPNALITASKSPVCQCQRLLVAGHDISVRQRHWLSWALCTRNAVGSAASCVLPR